VYNVDDVAGFGVLRVKTIKVTATTANKDVTTYIAFLFEVGFYIFLKMDLLPN
jgi:hypothetical protein